MHSFGALKWGEVASSGRLQKPSQLMMERLHPLQEKLMTIKGKTALVTGSTSGIGLGIAIELAKQGANILMNGFGDVEAPT